MFLIFRFGLFKNIKELCSNHQNLIVQIFAQILTQSTDLQLDENMLNLLQYHSILALKNPSPLIRTCGLKILNEILFTNFIPIEDVIRKSHI